MMSRELFSLLVVVAAASPARADDATQTILSIFENTCAAPAKPDSVDAFVPLAAKAGFAKEADDVDQSKGDDLDIFAVWQRGRGDERIELVVRFLGAPDWRAFNCSSFAHNVRRSA